MDDTLTLLNPNSHNKQEFCISKMCYLLDAADDSVRFSLFFAWTSVVWTNVINYSKHVC